MKTHQTHTPPLEQTPDVSEEQTTMARSRDHYLRSINPADRTVVGEVERTPVDQAPEILERAREIQRAWCRRPLETRAQRARSIFQELLQWRQELLELIVDETGKSPLEARRELWTTWEEIRDMIADAGDRLEPADNGGWLPAGRRTQTRWRPRGVVLVIASEYDPLQTTVAPAMAAMLAGNAAIVVGDAQSPLTGRSIVNVATACGIPDRLWTSVVGDDRLIDRLADSADAVISYGSARRTRRIARRQAERMIPVMGRWSTDDVMVVLADADVEKAARAAVRAACTGGGRNRRSLRRIYVQKPVVDPFVDAVVKEVGALRQADRGDQDGLEVGPLSTPHQLEVMEELIDDASRRGARLVAGGRPRPRCRGNYFEPTVMTGVDESMRLFQESAPGPVVAVAAVEAPAEAVARTTDIDGYGAVSLYTDNRQVALNMADKLQAPVVGINEVVRDLPASAPQIRTTIDGPVDPVGADRLRPLSRRIVTVDSRPGPIPSLLEIKTPKRMEQMLDTALAMIHRRGWLRNTVASILPGN